MPIMSKPSVVRKNATSVFSIDKSELALHPKVVASSHFSNTEAWDKVIIKYKSLTLGQFEQVQFDAKTDAPKGQFYVSPIAEDIFQIEKISIIDKDGAILLISRDDLTPAEYDINFNAVTDYDIDYTFFAKTGTYGAYMDISSDEKTIVVQNNYVSNYNQKHYFNAVVNDTTAEINEVLTAFVNYYHVDSYYFNNELTYVYIAGRLGESFRGEELPALPLPNQANNPNFNVTRIVKVDIATKEVTHIGDLPLRANGSAEDIAYNIIADSISDVLVVICATKIFGFKISTKEKLWEKNIGYYDNQIPRRKIYLYTTGSFLLGDILQYDSSTFSYIRPVKINILTGNIDNTFPACPSDTWIHGSGNSSNWALTPDKSKIIQQGVGDQNRFFVFENGSWSSIRTIEGEQFTGTMLDVSNTHIFFNKIKCDFMGVRETSYANLGVSYYWTPSNLLYAGSTVYIEGIRFNSTSGAWDQPYSFSGYVLPFGYNNNLVFYKKNTLSNYYSHGAYDKDSEYHYGGRVAVIDAETQEMKYSFTSSVVNPTESTKIKIGGLNNTKFFKFGLYLNTLSNVHTIGETSATPDNTYPLVSSSGQIAGGDIDNEWLYLMSFNIGETNTFSITQSSGLNAGTHTINSKLCRINHITKETDTTFSPAIPNNFGGYSTITFSSNYIYLFGQFNGVPSTFYRINKTTKSVQEITAQTLGISSPTTFSGVLGKIKVAQASNNKIVIYSDNNSLRFDDRPYVKLNEDTLEKTLDQPAVHNFRPYQVIYNHKTNQLAGFYKNLTTAEVCFITYDLETNLRVVHDTLIFNPDINVQNNLLPEDAADVSNSMFYTIKPFENSYLMHTDGMYIKRYRSFVGVVRLPLLT